MTRKRYEHIYGPVPSRRLGRSLGVDLIPHKICPFDCLYCQVGRTTLKTARRDAYVPADAVLAELGDRLAAGVDCDYITLAGSGEPTLHSDLARIVTSIKEMTETPLAVITDSSLLWDGQVRSAILPADLVVPSLDAGDAETFEKINRPCREITFEAIVEGLKKFRLEFSGEIRLEVFLVSGINDSESQVRRIKAIADQICPDSIEVNTISRPPPEANVLAVPAERLARLCEILGPVAYVITRRDLAASRSVQVSREDIMDMLRRRPCTMEDMAEGLQCSREKIAELIDQLTGQGEVVPCRRAGKAYYQARLEHDK